ncbi:hypothetical protein Vretimale_4017, partial [Volvox reticuliferus]
EAAITLVSTEVAAVPRPSASRSADGKCVARSGSGDAPGSCEKNTAGTPMGLDTWMWNCAGAGAVSGNRSYGCVTVAGREKATGSCECGCRYGCRNAVESGWKDHDLSGAPDCPRVPAEGEMCMWAAGREDHSRGSTALGFAVENAIMGAGCRCKSVTVTSRRTRESFLRHFLKRIRKLVSCGP